MIHFSDFALSIQLTDWNDVYKLSSKHEANNSLFKWIHGIISIALHKSTFNILGDDLNRKNNMVSNDCYVTQIDKEKSNSRFSTNSFMCFI